MIKTKTLISNKNTPVISRRTFRWILYPLFLSLYVYMGLKVEHFSPFGWWSSCDADYGGLTHDGTIDLIRCTGSFANDPAIERSPPSVFVHDVHGTASGSLSFIVKRGLVELLLVGLVKNLAAVLRESWQNSYAQKHESWLFCSAGRLANK